MENIRAKIKRRFSHKDPDPNLSDSDSGDEETSTYLNKEINEADKNDAEPYGKKGTLLNRLIEHGNKKTEAQLEREHREAEQLRASRQTGAGAAPGTTTTAGGVGQSTTTAPVVGQTTTVGQPSTTTA